MAKRRSFFFSFLRGSGKTFLYQQAFQALGNTLGHMAESWMERKRQRRPEAWKEELQTIRLTLGLEPKIREQFVRLLTYLHSQNRHEDLRRLQQFLNAANQDTAALGDAPKIIEHLTSLIGDSGNESDFTQALGFLTGIRVIGLPENTSGGKTGAAELHSGITKTFDSVTNWFKQDLEKRRARHRGGKTTS